MQILIQIRQTRLMYPLLKLNGGCVIVNKASGEVLAEAADKTAGLSPVMQAIREPIE